MDITQKMYRVEGMHCAGCVASVEKSLLGVDGVQSAVVNLSLENVRIKKNSQVSFKELRDALQIAGYTLVEKQSEDISKQKEKDIHLWRQRFIWVGLLGFPLLIYSMWEMIEGGDLTAKSIIFQFCLATSIIYISRHFYINGLAALIYRNPNMNSLVALGTGAAYVYSLISSINIINSLGISGFEKLYFESAGVILVFITMGRYLEAHAKNQTTQALFNLFNHIPRTGWVKKDDKWLEVSVKDIQKGDQIMVKPGRRVPVDGVVIDGSSFVDESAITGEPVPVEKTSGDTLTGASINTTGMLIMEAVQVGENTVFSRIIQMVEHAQNSKAPIQSLADRVAAVFVPIVMGLAILSMVGWLIAGLPLVFAFNIFISVLIIACPCALGLATPTAIVVGTGLGAQSGIHFKSAEALQNLSEITSIIFDKTGTLTLGKPRVVDFISDIDDKEFILYLSSLEQGSEHPLAEAVINFAKIQDIQVDECTDVTAIVGRGIQGIVREKDIQAGSLNWFNELNIQLPPSQIMAHKKWENEGYTIIHTASNGEWIGMVSISDTLRKESKSIINTLKQNRLKVYLLTGDRKASGEHFANQLGIDNIHSELLPHEKVEYVENIQKIHGKVAMVGDGINDAPALATADIGIAIGSGTDIAMETSDVVLLQDDLHSIVNSWQLSKRVVNKIKQNLFWAFVFNIVGIPIAMGLLYPFSGYLLNPMLAGAAMAFSSVSVVGNTLLLKNWRGERNK